MNLSNQILVQLDNFVQSIAEGQHLPQQKFICDMLYAMITSGSVVLAEIARHLESDKELIHIEKRLSRWSQIAALRRRSTQSSVSRDGRQPDHATDDTGA